MDFQSFYVVSYSRVGPDLLNNSKRINICMSDDTASKLSSPVNRRRVLRLVGGGATSIAFVGAAEAAPGKNGRDKKSAKTKEGPGGGVGPCTCEECADGYFCGKVDGAPAAGESYTFSDGSESYSVTIDSVRKKNGNEVTCFSFSSDDDIEKVCIKGGPDTATYDSDPEGKRLCAPQNPGGNQAEISNFSFCGREAEQTDYFQVDLAGGNVADPPLYGNLDQNDDKPDRLLEAFDVSSEGDISDPDDPLVFADSYNGSKTVMVDGKECTFSWESFDFDAQDDRVIIDDLTLSATSDNSECTVTLAGYELPEGDTEATRSNIEDQKLIDFETKTINVEETTSLEISLEE